MSGPVSVLPQRVRVSQTTIQQRVTKAADITRVTTGGQGPRGVRGETGPAGGTGFIRLASAALSAQKMVWEDELGYVRELGYTDADHIDLMCGITVTAASSSGQEVEVRRAGPVDLTGTSFTPGRVYLGAGGGLTQTPPDDGYLVVVGYAVSQTRLYLSFTDNIFLGV